jgi:alpha,alpha-trehalase
MKEWTLVYEGFEPGRERLREALCTLGNGYFATRGAAEESATNGAHYPGTYLAGGYDRLKTEIAGRVVENESLVNMPNWLALTFRIDDGDWFDLSRVEILTYRQELDLRRGVLLRTIRFQDRKGRRTNVSSQRLVSMADSHLAALQTTYVPENWSGRMEIRSALDGKVVNSGVARYRDLNNRHLMPLETRKVSDEAIYLKVQTSQSEIRVAEAARTWLSVGGQRLESECDVVQEPGYIAQHFNVDVAEGREVTIEKVASLFTSRDRAVSECGLAAIDAIQGADIFEQLQERHMLAWQRLWDRFDIGLEFSTPEDEQNRTALILHLHIFHLLQTTSMRTIDLDVGVPARGWHGEAYRGHVFWDGMFIFPLLNLRIPDITRSLQLYRYRRLDAARRGARAAGFSGAMYPWQSGSDGREETQVVHLNPKSGRWLPDHSHLQRHINAAIVYDIWHYYQVTADLEFLCFYGAEMIFEIARLWASLVTYNRKLDRYEILGVMGPDEYHDGYPDSDKPGLNNNSYTNLMAVWVLCRALDLEAILPAEHCRRVSEKLNLLDEEVQRWDEISRKMNVVFHADGILSQFEGYENLAELDWPAYRKKYGSSMRLDRILEAEGDSPNRYKVSKQADVMMLFYLFSAEELKQLFERLGYHFDAKTIPRTVEFYLERTSHGSTLSEITHSWVLARSDRPRSWKLFTRALHSDLADVQGGTTPEGIHLGAMAGTVDLIQRGYTGIDTRQDTLWLDPSLPNELASVRLKIRYRQASLALEVTHEVLRIQAVHCPDEPIRIGFQNQVLELLEGQHVNLTLKKSHAT